MIEHSLELFRTKPAKETSKSRHTCHMTQSEDATQCFVKPDQCRVRKAPSARPNGHQKTLHHQHRINTPIAARLRQRRSAQSLFPSQTAQHLFEHSHPTPRRELLVGKAPRQPRTNSHFFVHPPKLTKPRSLSSSHVSYCTYSRS